MKTRYAAARYAKVVFELAKERNQTDAVSRDLAAVARIYRDRPDLREFFARPSLPGTAKRGAALAIARGADLTKLVGDTFALMAERGRARQIGTVAAKYEKRLDAELGRVRGRVRTAVPLTEDERQRLQATLGKLLQSDRVVLDEIIDPAVLGGFVVETDAVVIDGSVKAQLNAMRQWLGAAPSVNVENTT